jgi:ribonuclease E
MTKRMLIDATHPEETRVVVLDGHRLADFDFETSTKKQLKGNIYLAKVTRVEPSLQAAFVDYGGNRHGFLAFSEIHPDYYQIPVADREKLLAEFARIERGEMAESEGHRDRNRRRDRNRYRRGGRKREPVDALSAPAETAVPEGPVAASSSEAVSPTAVDVGGPVVPQADSSALSSAAEPAAPSVTVSTLASAPQVSRYSLDIPGIPTIGEAPPRADMTAPVDRPAQENAQAGLFDSTPSGDGPRSAEVGASLAESVGARPTLYDSRPADGPPGPVEAEQRPSDVERTPAESEGGEGVETLGGDEMEELARWRHRMLRQYKIQEVIKRRQILLIQVVKEERGNKGAALTTYLSLAGRYCVLMPNTARGGGVSRKITSAVDRKRLKTLIDELALPEGMGLIVRTAGSLRTKTEIKRDCDYLVRLWDTIREKTLQSTAPCLIHGEADLIKRSIRDLYTRDLEEVMVDGDEGYKAAKDFMKMLMPSHAKRVQRYRDGSVPLFQRYQVESQLDAMHSPVVPLRSGGSIVISPTEALVAIDVNSGRATRERHIEETALKTNLEAADEIGRQLRLRDLAGLIVIDFIDMEEHRHNQQVERRLKEVMRADRARIQIGRISPFGLLELSRQRLRPSLVEASSSTCPHCGGTGHIRSTESTALHVLRAIEEEGSRRRASEILVYVPTSVAMYILNQKRGTLTDIERRHALTVLLQQDDALVPPAHRVERTKARAADAPPVPATSPAPTFVEDADDDAATAEAEPDAEAAEVDERTPPRAAQRGGEAGEDRNGRRRRRRRRGRRGEDVPRPPQAPLGEPMAAASEEPAESAPAAGGGTGPVSGAGAPARAEGEGDGDFRRRRRGRRGGRRRGRRGDRPEGPVPLPMADEPPPAAAPFAAGGAVLLQDEVASAFERYETIADQPPPPAPAADWRPIGETSPPPAASRVESPPLSAPATPAPRAPEPPPADPNPPVQIIGPGEVESSRPKRAGWWSRPGRSS